MARHICREDRCQQHYIAIVTRHVQKLDVDGATCFNSTLIRNIGGAPRWTWMRHPGALSARQKHSSTLWFREGIAMFVSGWEHVVSGRNVRVRGVCVLSTV